MKSKIITSDDILGKDAVDPEGKILGVVVKLHIDNSNRQITGLTVDQGFMKPDLFIGINHIKRFGVDAILISKIPADRFKGMKVLSSEGKTIGIVDSVIMKRTNPKALVIVPDTISLSKKKSRVAMSDVKEIGASVILKKEYKLKEVD